MDPGTLIALVVLVLALVAAGLSWRSPASYLCIVIAGIMLISLLPGGPW
jgi:hypothetical protein